MMISHPVSGAVCVLLKRVGAAVLHVCHQLNFHYNPMHI